MLKKRIQTVVVMVSMSLMLTSCFSYTSTVGNGAQGNDEETEWNHLGTS